MGFPAGSVRVPIVPAAVIFRSGGRRREVSVLTKRWGIKRALTPQMNPVTMGGVGAGTGATVGKAPGVASSLGGVGSACLRLDSGLVVAALVVVNALGNVVHLRTGEILAGGKEKR